MQIWIINPFDQLPNETDVPLRYWTLCRVLAEQGHEVIWWSSDFSHLTKSKRQACPPTDGFTVRLIKTPPYAKNISLKRLKNHRVFACGFYREAVQRLQSGDLKAPDRIVLSLPPLGIAEKAFKLRDFINLSSANKAHHDCQVVVDIMDAWPETFYRALPGWLPQQIKKALLYPLHRSAKRAYTHADKISAVGQTYLDLAEQYLHAQSASRSQRKKDFCEKSIPSEELGEMLPRHLCHHGTDLTRFEKIPTDTRPATTPGKAVYLGAMGNGYDLQTIIKVAQRWQVEGRFPWQLHFAGEGPLRNALESISADLIKEERVIFHGYLGKEAINKLLLTSDLALVPNRPDSRVACPYKAAEYAAAGLPMISCLKGELDQLLTQWNAGSEYKEGDADSLYTAFQNYLTDSERLNQHSRNARKMAEVLFDRNQTYATLTKFMLHSSQY